ncbi:hypothetical protein [Pseudoxanthomonas sp.]|uniref:hypothetical protein n=1 Tax=Pseudoxanthomonas sp. TaxID=1871049 RepID=UPI0025D9E67C|nr:hypothetical protein [Pseudoxanthomonas sp.]
MATLGAALITSCVHHRLGPKTEHARVARGFGLAAGCEISESMRRYETLDFADLLGNPNLADSAEWATAISIMQPGDQLRHVNCDTGENYFGLFRDSTALFKFGRMIND